MQVNKLGRPLKIQKVQKSMIPPSFAAGRKGKGKSKMVRRRNRQARRVGPSVYAADTCALEYAKALVDPFGLSGVCAPYEGSARSVKFSAHTRGTFASGTTGVGWVGFNPYLACDNTANALRSTSSTSVGNATTTLAAFTNYASVPLATPYANVPVAKTNSVRLVAAGLKIKCTASPLNAQGLVAGYVVPANQDGSAFSWDLINNSNLLPMETVASVIDDEYMVTWAPGPPTDTSFYDQLSEFPTSTLNGPLIIMVNTAAATYFSYEAIAHYEGIGNGFYTGQMTSTIPDPRAAVLAGPASNVQGGVGHNYFASVSDTILSALPQIGSNALPLARELLRWSNTRAYRTGEFARMRAIEY